MNGRRALRIAGTVVLLAVAGYFYWVQVADNWSSIQQFRLAVGWGYLVASLSLYVLSYLLEAYAWHFCIKKHPGRPALTFAQSIAVVHGSGFLRYLPGRVWTYTAQMVWLRKYGISKPAILYVNLICIVGSMTVTLYLGLIYLVLYTHLLSTTAAIVAFAAVVLLNLAYMRWNAPIINRLTAFVAAIFKRQITPVQESQWLIAFVQFMYVCSWLTAGVGGYFLAAGIGLRIVSTEMFAVLAAMSLSWLAGYLAFLAPGGLGVREAVMLSMLDHVVSPQTALIFPILSRLMYLVADILLASLSLSIGLRSGVFSSGTPDDGD